jgi:hypothetical protein
MYLELQTTAHVYHQLLVAIVAALEGFVNISVQAVSRVGKRKVPRLYADAGSE